MTRQLPCVGAYLESAEDRFFVFFGKFYRKLEISVLNTAFGNHTFPTLFMKTKRWPREWKIREGGKRKHSTRVGRAQAEAFEIGKIFFANASLKIFRLFDDLRKGPQAESVIDI